ncbi:MAG: DUF58 domain-containing protein [Lachnospiraceae bacterium]|nr:DUF58 domain-containing protein [Lachnospiraceae bacterium]
MKNRASIFATIGGLLFLLILVFYTNTMRYQKISGFLIFFLILFLCSWIWGKVSLKKMRIQMQREDLTAFPGESLPVRLSIENKKLLPVTWLDILFPLPDNRCVWVPEDDDISWHDAPGRTTMLPVFLRKVSWIFPFQKLEWSFALEARCRGIYHMDTVYLESGDGLGLSVISRKIPLAYTKQITVYPERIPVDVSPLLHQNPSQAKGHQGYQDDLTLLKNSRAYQYGDSFRRINWRLLARQQELMVNEYETLSPQCMGFYIDLESFITKKEEQTNAGTMMITPTLHQKELEQMLSLIGSCICELTARRVSCALFIPGYEKQEVRCCFGSDLEYQVPQLLEELAQIDYQESAYETRITSSDLRIFRSKLGQVYYAGMKANLFHAEPVLEAFGSHRLSYLVHEHCEEEQRLERPLYALFEISFLTKEVENS